MKKKTFEERYFDEKLTDNTKIKRFEQCKNCLFQSDGTVWSNNYEKGCCAIYQHPESKPHHVYEGSAPCEYYEKQK